MEFICRTNVICPASFPVADGAGEVWMALRFIDLHTHSTASDGSFSPSRLVGEARSLGLAALALTDHDTLEGLDEAERAVQEKGTRSPDFSFEFIRGCELSSRCGPAEAHILGLWIGREERDVSDLKEKLAEVRAQRFRRNVAMAEKLRGLGFAVRLEDVEALAGGEVVARPHFAALLLRMGVVKSVREAFEKFLGYRGAAYVPRELMKPEEAVELLAGSGATVVLAHPMLMRCPVHELDELIARLKPHGLNALEAYHSEHGAADERVCVELAARHGLLLSGGSDFHGESKPLVRLGKGHGALRVSEAVLESLKRARMEQGLPV